MERKRDDEVEREKERERGGGERGGEREKERERERERGGGGESNPGRTRMGEHLYHRVMLTTIISIKQRQ